MLDIARGVAIRANGNAELCSDGRFVCAIPHLHASQYPSGRELTAQQRKRAQDVIASMLADWVATHAGDIAQADDIDRNNAALSLEEDIARHEAALTILRAELAACEEGEPFTQYPDLPTKRR